MFNFLKDRKSKKAEKLDIKRRELEFNYKLKTKNTLNKIKNESNKNQEALEEFVIQARKAKEDNNEQNLKTAKRGIKACLFKKKFIDSMVMQVEISNQMSNFNTNINDYIKEMESASNRMKDITPTIDMCKAQAAYQRALASNENQYEALDAFMDAASESIDLATSNNGVKDEDVDSLINDLSKSSKESTVDKEIDDKLLSLQEKINNA